VVVTIRVDIHNETDKWKLSYLVVLPLSTLRSQTLLFEKEIQLLTSVFLMLERKCNIWKHLQLHYYISMSCSVVFLERPQTTVKFYIFWRILMREHVFLLKVSSSSGRKELFVVKREKNWLSEAKFPVHPSSPRMLVKRQCSDSVLCRKCWKHFL